MLIALVTIFSAQQSDFTTELKFNAARNSPVYAQDVDAPPSLGKMPFKNVLSIAELENDDLLNVRWVNERQWLVRWTKTEAIVWAVRVNSDPGRLAQTVVGASRTFTAVAEGTFQFASFSTPKGQSFVVLRNGDGKGAWRWFPAEAFYGRRDVGAVTKDCVGQDGSLQFKCGIRYIPGYVAGLGSTVTLSSSVTSAYFRTLSAMGYVESTIPLPYDELGVLEDFNGPIQTVCHAMRLLNDYAERLRTALGVQALLGLTPAESKSLDAAADFKGVIMQQISDDEALELLTKKFNQGVAVFTKAFNAAIGGKLMVKSPTVSRGFSPNTAALVRKAVEAESLTPVQVRRVNAQYLLDCMNSDLGIIAIAKP